MHKPLPSSREGAGVFFSLMAAVLPHVLPELSTPLAAEPRCVTSSPRPALPPLRSLPDPTP
jgi:hypothetical protein